MGDDKKLDNKKMAENFEKEVEKLHDKISQLESKISELEKSSKTLEESELSFRTIVENSNDTIMRFDKKHQHLYANTRVERESGIPAKDFIGKTHGELGFPPSLVKIWENAIATVFETGKEHRIEFQLPSGVWIDWLLTPEFDGKLGVQSVLTSARDITERKVVELKLQNERYLLQTFMDNVPDHIYFKDTQGRFTNANRAQAQWLGAKDKDSLIGKSDSDFFSSEHSDSTALEENEIIRTGHQITKEEKETWPDGRVTWVNTTKMPLFDIDKNVIGTFGISRDITGRKRTMFALAESERRYRRLTENAQDIIWRTTIDGEILFMNSAVKRLLGYKTEETFGLTGQTYLSESSRSRLQQWIEKAVRNPKIANFSGELEYINKEGRPILFEASVVAIRDENGRITALEGISRDITARKRAELALRESEERYRILVESINDIIYRTDINGYFIFANPVAERIIGYPENELNKIHYLQFVREDYKEEVRIFYNKQFRDKTSSTYLEFPLRKKNGSVIWIGQNVQLNYVKGRIKGFLAVARDITERKIAEDALIQVHDNLEKRVEARTSELSKSNKLLLQEINDRRRAQTELQSSLSRYQAAMEGIIKAMALTVEMRDPYTAGHQQRVTELAQAIAKEMGLLQEQIDGIRMAGIIHDLGKISIPAEILNKPGKISEIVFDMIKIHPTVGYEILKSIDFPWPLAKIVHQHHERMNGSGYPQGLKGDQIILEARILMVADVFEAVSSHRPYRPALGMDKALDEVVKNKGELYDPEVVDACAKVVQKRGFKFEYVEKDIRDVKDYY